MNLMRGAREELALFGVAVRFLTRLPGVGAPEASHDAARLARATRYHPLVGALIGAFAGAVFWLAHLVFPMTLAVVLSTAATVLITGALHEDGFADACDGLGGGATRERALAIMRDSRLGTYGVAGLGFVLAAKVLALAALPAEVVVWLLIAAHAASRASAVVALATGAYAREEGIATSFDAAVGSGTLGGAGALGVLLAIAPLLAASLPVAAALAGVAGLAVGHLVMRGAYQRKLGGWTGDCLGGVQQLSELGFYLGVLAAL